MNDCGVGHSRDHYCLFPAPTSRPGRHIDSLEALEIFSLSVGFGRVSCSDLYLVVGPLDIMLDTPFLVLFSGGISMAHTSIPDAMLLPYGGIVSDRSALNPGVNCSGI